MWGHAGTPLTASLSLVQVKGDVLSNLCIDFVTDALWGNVGLAMAFVAAVKVGFVLCCLWLWLLAVRCPSVRHGGMVWLDGCSR